ncbi:MAG: glycosyltransferase [Acidobacteria bacterium]|nr:MAG: glycosyltransferase [Acidobacteriota bacterium]
MTRFESETANARPRVLLCDNEMSPYKLPLYEELSKIWDLTVYFSRHRGAGRLWHVDPQKWTFRYHVLKRLPWIPFTINPSLPFRVLGSYDICIVAGGALQDAYGMLTAIAAAKVRRRPSIFWTDAFIPSNPVPVDFGWLHEAKRFLERQLYDKLLFRLPDYFMAQGLRPVEELRKRGVSEDRIAITIWAVPELEEDPPILPEEVRELTATKRVIMTAAYFRKSKGIDGVIRAFRRLKGEDLCLIIMGEGRDRARLESLTGNDSRIHFVGFCEGRRKWGFFFAAEIFLLFTYQDPWGLVINEAMQCGSAIVTTDGAGCVTHLVRNGENGLVIKAGDEDALYRALERLTSDWSLVRRMGDRSREAIADLGIAKVTQDFAVAVRTWTNQGSKLMTGAKEAPTSQVIHP